MSRIGIALVAALAHLATPTAAQSARAELRDAAEAILDALLRGTDGDDDEFLLTIEGHLRRSVDITAPRVEGPRRQSARIRLGFRRLGGRGLVVTGESPWADFELRRTAPATELFLPRHGVRFVAADAAGVDHLTPEGFLGRLLGRQVGAVELVRGLLLAKAATLREIEDRPGVFRIDAQTTVRGGEVNGNPTLTFDSPREIAAGVDSLKVELEALSGGAPDGTTDAPATFHRAAARVEKVDRTEFETMILRALRRSIQTHAPLPALRPGAGAKAAKVDHGELRNLGGQRVALLHGSPEEIGAAHGALLGDLVRQTVDSSLYLVGLVETVRTGKWFPTVLAGAWGRLSPHIPATHRRELDAVADAIPGLSRRELRLANVFPEYFHCSGFAVFGRATKDGKLYHGRVLDYMTMIGLQHAAVTYVIKPERGYGFLNVGYAGFIGSVTGMNEQQISLGEMGGRGELEWDGVPMATLMRRALEECHTLDQVKALWRDSPRTCEYYYVFADGKQRRAVGVAATPARIDFLDPGQDHELLGKGIADTLLMSAGGRLQRLRERVEQQHGKIDAELALRLMDRPVAMASNLHNALMMPEDGVVLVAHAGPPRPAAEMEYVRFDLRELLAGLPGTRTLIARDTIVPPRQARQEAAAMLARFTYPAARFDVRLRPRMPGDDSNWNTLVEFPSPKPPTPDGEDRVALEWYHANPRRLVNGKAPAVLVLHILDGRMRIARGIARVLANKGMHAFVMHMPGYGRRRDGGGRRPDAAQFFSRAHQAVADARRARDAIAATPGVDPVSISIQGTSLGAFIAALAAAIDDGFDRTFLMLAGGDLPDMFVNGRRDTAVLRAQMHAAGFKDAELARMLRTIDPEVLAHRLPAGRTWLYSARGDTVVPAANARALGKAANLDEQHHLWFSGDHYTCALHLPAILAHMVERLR